MQVVTLAPPPCDSAHRRQHIEQLPKLGEHERFDLSIAADRPTAFALIVGEDHRKTRCHPSDGDPHILRDKCGSDRSVTYVGVRGDSDLPSLPPQQRRQCAFEENGTDGNDDARRLADVMPHYRAGMRHGDSLGDGRLPHIVNMVEMCDVECRHGR